MKIHFTEEDKQMVNNQNKANTYIRHLKEDGSHEPRGRTGIKSQT